MPRYPVMGTSYSYRVDAKEELTRLINDKIKIYIEGKTLDNNNPDIKAKVTIRDLKLPVQTIPVMVENKTYNKTCIMPEANYRLDIYDKDGIPLAHYKGEVILHGTFAIEVENPDMIEYRREDAKKKLLEEIFSRCNQWIADSLTGRFVKEKFYVYTIKPKKYNYQDMDSALNYFMQAIAQYNDKGLNNEVENLLNKSITIWKNAVAEYDPSNKDARINEKNVGEIYTNLANAHIWLTKYDKAKEYINLALKFDGHMSDKERIKKIIDDFSQKIEYQKKYLAEIESYKLAIKKFFSKSDLNGDEKYRIVARKYVSVDPKPIRNTYEYSEDGLLRSFSRIFDYKGTPITMESKNYTYDLKNGVIVCAYSVSPEAINNPYIKQSIKNTSDDIDTFKVVEGKVTYLSQFRKMEFNNYLYVYRYTYDNDKISIISKSSLTYDKDNKNYYKDSEQETKFFYDTNNHIKEIFSKSRDLTQRWIISWDGEL